jgi:hypothetical protein
MTFRSMFVKPFNVLDVEIEVNPLELECNNQETESEKGIIVINTSPAIPLKHGKGRPCKYTDIIIFLQDDV